MSTDTMTATQVYRVYIKATPERIWDAITKPEWTQRYGYTNIAEGLRWASYNFTNPLTLLGLA